MKLKITYNDHQFEYSAIDRIIISELLKRVKNHNLVKGAEQETFYLEFNGARVPEDKRLNETDLQENAQVILKKAVAVIAPHAMPPPPAPVGANVPRGAAAAPNPQAGVLPPPPPFPEAVREEKPQLHSLIKVTVNGRPLISRAKEIPIQPIFCVSNQDTGRVKHIVIALKKRANGEPIAGCEGRNINATTIVFQLGAEVYLDYDQEYLLEVRCQASNYLRGNPPKAPFQFRTGPKVCIVNTADEPVLEGGQAVAVLPYGDVRLMTNNFDDTSEKIESRATGKLGKGSFGEVFKGLATNLTFKQASELRRPFTIPAKRVAIKRLKVKEHRFILYPQLQESMRREINVLKDPDFNHVNIVRLLAYVSLPFIATDGSAQQPVENNEFYYDQLLDSLDLHPCLVYELLPLGSLESLLKDDSHQARNMTCKIRLSIIIGISQGLRHLHTGKPGFPAFHRDIKSANVCLDLDFTPKLIDWGLARFRKPEGDGVETAINQRMGSECYSCPEYMHSNGPAEYSALCDIYSFGLVILEVLSGKLHGRIYKGAVLDFRNMTAQQMQNDRHFADTRCGVWPDNLVHGLQKIALKCIQRQSINRYQSMNEVVEELLELERLHITPQHWELEVEERVLQLQKQVEDLSLQHHVEARVNSMTAMYHTIENSRNQRMCSDPNCLNEFAAADKGICCPLFSSAHFYCDECFGAFVREQLDDEEGLKENEFQLICPECNQSQTKTFFPVHTIAKHTDSVVFDEFLSKREATKVHAEVLLRESLLEQQKQNMEMRAEQALHRRIATEEAKYTRDVSSLTQQVERLAGQLQAEEERRRAEEQRRRIEEERRRAEEQRRRTEATRHIARIQNDTLKLHCPHCQAVMVESSQLLAQCMSWQHRDGCNRFCCGLCMQPFSDTSACHKHVKECPLNPQQGNYFVRDEEQRLNARAPQRRNRLNAYLAENVQDAEVKSLVLAGLAPILQRLRVTI